LAAQTAEGFFVCDPLCLSAQGVAVASHSESEVEFSFSLYITGQKPASRSAIGNLERLCDAHLKGRYENKVVDILEHPQIAEQERILATPMVVRQSPEPVRRVIGDLSNTDKVLEGLDLVQAFPASLPQ
jgi:circadian clock protein KaiB